MRNESSRVPILMYHRIERANPNSKVSGHYVPPGLFNRQMRTMAKLGYKTVPLSGLYATESSLSLKPFCVTFDDGYENFLTRALPSLQGLGFTATVFLVTDLIGKSNFWDSSQGDVAERLLSREQVAECQAAGTEFGSHTLDHADLTACSDADAWRQISDSKTAVEEVTGRPALTFCYPYGRFTTGTRDMVRRAGYAVACSTLKGLKTGETDPYALPRINVRRDTSVPVLLWKLLRGAYLGR